MCSKSALAVLRLVFPGRRIKTTKLNSRRRFLKEGKLALRQQACLYTSARARAHACMCMCSPLCNVSQAARRVLAEWAPCVGSVLQRYTPSTLLSTLEIGWHGRRCPHAHGRFEQQSACTPAVRCMCCEALHAQARGPAAAVAAAGTAMQAVASNPPPPSPTRLSCCGPQTHRHDAIYKQRGAAAR